MQSESEIFATLKPATALDQLSGIYLSRGFRFDLAQGAAALHEYRSNKSLATLNASILSLRRAYLADHRRDKSWRVVVEHLSLAFFYRFAKTGDYQDRDEASSLLVENVSNEDDANASVSADQIIAEATLDLESSLGFLAFQTGALNEAINRLRNALRLAPPESLIWYAQAYNLSSAFGSMYSATRNEDSLVKALELLRSALNSLSRLNEPYIYCLQKYCAILGLKFECAPSEALIQEIIKCNVEILELSNNSDMERAEKLGNLGEALRQRYQLTQELDDLDRAVHLSEQALFFAQENDSERLTLAGDSMWDTYHFHHLLGLALIDRYDRTHDAKDLHRSVTCSEQVLSSGYSSKSEIANLGWRLGRRFAISKDKEDLDRGIVLLEEALATDRLGSSTAAHLSNLGIMFGHRFQVTGDVADCESGIAALRKALDITAPTQLQWGNYHNSLASLLLFQSHGSAITSALNPEKTKVFIPKDSVEKIGEMCKSYEEAFHSVHSPAHIRMVAGENAINLHITRANMKLGPLLDSAGGFHSDAIQEATENLYAPIQELCFQAIALLLKLTPRDLFRRDQQYKLSRLYNLPSTAAAVYMYGKGDLVKAWWVLEAGSSVMTGLAIELRRDLNELREQHPEVAKRHHEAREAVLVTDMKRFSLDPGIQAITGRQEAAQKLRSSETHIRSLPGFETFGLPFDLVDIVKLNLCSEGPVVAINVHALDCQALVYGNGCFTCFNLLDLHLEDVEKHVNLIIGPRSSSLTSGRLKTLNKRNKGLRDILHWLWVSCVQNVLEKLGMLNPDVDQQNKPQIWWYSSGPMGHFPLHAAGVYGNGSKANAMNYVLSSYTPTLKTLAYSRLRQAASANITKPEALVVAMPETPGGKSSDLRLDAELCGIREALSPNYAVNIQLKPSGKDIIDRLKTASIAHFACHGVSDTQDPSDSLLKLYNAENDKVDPLRIRDIAHLSYPNAQLAYLSACSTAKNSVLELNFESIHIVNAFQLLGFPHVVGTLWQTNDDAAALVATLFYRKLFGGMWETCRVLDSRNVVSALYEAIEELQKEDPEDVLTWAPFVHFGA